MKERGINILIVGKGGQGVLVAGDIVATVFVNEGYDVKSSAVHGIAQRGGPVSCHIRAGNKIYSPVIAKGKADILIILDSGEGWDSVKYLKETGPMFFVMRHMSQATADNFGPIRKRFKENPNPKIVQVSYEEAVKGCGNIKLINVFMLGVFSKLFSIKESSWVKVIIETFSRYTRKANLAAFSSGRKLKTRFSAKA